MTKNQHWLVGKTVTAVRPMSRQELEDELWEHSAHADAAVAIAFDDGTVLYASMDGEGNGPGMIFGLRGDETFLLTASSPEMDSPQEDDHEGA